MELPAVLFFLSLVTIQGRAEQECVLESTEDFFEHFGCVELFSKPRPIPNESIYRFLQETYIATVGVGQSTIGVQRGFFPNIRVRYAHEAGRGVFAQEIVRKGDPVYTSTVGAKTAMFRTASAFRQFLRNVNNEWVCDLLVWCYPFLENDDDEHSVVMACDLDEGSLINDEDAAYDPVYPSEDQHTKNIGCDEDAAKKHQGGCKYTEFALRDIEVGDEIIAAYGDFSEDIATPWFKFPWVENGNVTYE